MKYKITIKLISFLSLLLSFNVFANNAVTQNLVEASDGKVLELTAIAGLVMGVAYLAGSILFLSGIYKFKKNGENAQAHPIATAVWMVIAGVLLLSAPTFYNAVSSTIHSTFVGASGVDILAVNQHIQGFDVVESNFGFSRFIPTGTGKAILAFIYVVGLISFVKGIFMLKDTGETQKQLGFSAAMVHIFAGAIAMNISQFSCLVGDFFNTKALCLGGA